jgi:MFS family permease
MKENFKIFLSGMMALNFMSGIEFGLTITTVNKYILSKGAPQSSIGYIFTCFAVSGLISSPIFG